jgi:hypothetical protein
LGFTIPNPFFSFVESPLKKISGKSGRRIIGVCWKEEGGAGKEVKFSLFNLIILDTMALSLSLSVVVGWIFGGLTTN